MSSEPCRAAVCRQRWHALGDGGSGCGCEYDVFRSYYRIAKQYISSTASRMFHETAVDAFKQFSARDAQSGVQKGTRIQQKFKSAN